MEIIGILRDSFLFAGIDEALMTKILSEHPPLIQSFKRGELIYSSGGARCVGFVLSGRCEIRLDRSGGSKTVLNVLCESDSFGILSVYSEDEYPTKIYATKNSDILFFTDKQICGFVNNYSQISANLIKFLANRISFLNKKIATFSASSAEDRLAAFLLSERAKFDSNEFSFNAQKTSEEINVARASVYRAVASLESAGLITLSDKKIYIKDLDGLERITK